MGIGGLIARVSKSTKPVQKVGIGRPGFVSHGVGTVSRVSFGKKLGAASRCVASAEIGRPYAALVGLGVMVAGLGLSSGRNTVASTAIVAGSILVVLGALVPWFRRVSWKHGELEIEHPEIRKAEAAQDLAERQSQSGLRLRSGEDVDAARLYSARLALKAIYGDAAAYVPTFEQCEFRLFMYDEQRSLLVAAVRPLDQLAVGREWRPGEGAIGVAYESGAYVVAVGDQTHDETFNLDASAQLAYAHLTEVAAMPLANASGRAVGVLSVSHSSDERILNTAAGYEAHARAAAAATRVVVDLLGLDNDD